MKPAASIPGLGVKRLLRLEGLTVLVISVALYAKMEYGWLLFALLFFTPDLSLLGYLGGSRIGAVAYNAFHTYVAVGLLGGIGVLSGIPILTASAVIWTAHIGLDRSLGYGLKSATAFTDTHLGMIGRKRQAVPVPDEQ